MKKITPKWERDPFLEFCSTQKDNRWEAFGRFDEDGNFFINYNCAFWMSRMKDMYIKFCKDK